MSLDAIKKEQDRAKAAGDVEVTSGNFDGAQRSLDSTSLELGDKITFPKVFDKIYKSKRFNGTQYILVETEGGKVVQFFPSTFTKRRQIVEADGTPIKGAFMKTEGTAADLFRTHSTINDGMKALAGKTIVVSKVNEGTTMRWGTKDTMTTQFLTIDLVEDKK